MHPAIGQVQVLWQSFNDRLLVDISAVTSTVPVPIGIEAFEIAATENNEESEEVLHTQWYPKILEIFSAGVGAPDVLGTCEEERAPIYKSANVLMAIQVQTMMDYSITQFAVDLGDVMKRPKFEIRLELTESGEYVIPTSLCSDIIFARVLLLIPVSGVLTWLPSYSQILVRALPGGARGVPAAVCDQAHEIAADIHSDRRVAGWSASAAAGGGGHIHNRRSAYVTDSLRGRAVQSAQGVAGHL
jgi:hypothetical protein